LLRLLQGAFRRVQIPLRLGQFALSVRQLGVIIIALGYQRVDLLAHLKNVQRASAQRRKYGYNQTNAHQHGEMKINGYGGRVNASLQIVESQFSRMA
jgi:hypothetical protein